MQLDIHRHLGAVERSVTDTEREGKPARAVALSRTYPTGIEDLWDAVSNRERLPRWFAPVTGTLEPGGRFQVQGNAGGTITECDPPRRFAATWEYGGDVSWIELRLDPVGEDTARLTLTHTAHPSEFWEKFGPGAVGVGWELGFLGLALHLDRPDAPRVDEAEFAASEDGTIFSRTSAHAWGEADIAGGAAPEQARGAARRTADFYTGVSPDEA
jgi:uncharacterized protein YndB with AHSA1/START domain